MEIVKILAQLQENITCGWTSLWWVKRCQSSLVGGKAWLKLSIVLELPVRSSPLKGGWRAENMYF